MKIDLLKQVTNRDGDVMDDGTKPWTVGAVCMLALENTQSVWSVSKQEEELANLISDSLNGELTLDVVQSGRLCSTIREAALPNRLKWFVINYLESCAEPEETPADLPLPPPGGN